MSKDPTDPTGKTRVLASMKCNLAEEPPSWAYHLEPSLNGSVRVIWDGQTSQTAITLLAVSTCTEEGEALGEAKAFLLDLLADGPVLVSVLLKKAKKADISERTLKRAKAALNVRSSKRSDIEKWEWYLPNQITTKDAKRAKDANNANLAITGDLGTLWVGKGDGAFRRGDDAEGLSGYP